MNGSKCCRYSVGNRPPGTGQANLDVTALAGESLGSFDRVLD